MRAPATAWTNPRANANPREAVGRHARTAPSADATAAPKRPPPPPPPRLLLPHERRARAAAVEVDHGVRAPPGDPGEGDERKRARREVERRIEVHVEGDDVVRQPPDPPHDPAEGAWGG